MPAHRVPARLRAAAFGPMGRTGARVFQYAAFAVVALEILAYAAHGLFSTVAARLWLLAWLLLCAYVVSRFVRDVVGDVRDGLDGARRWIRGDGGPDGAIAPWLSLAVLAGIAFLLIDAALDFQRIVVGQDATQQIAAGLAAFARPDWNYTGTAFLGYPARQYLIAAIPPFLLGRSIAALQLGFAGPFAIALMAFYTGLRAFARSRGLHPTLPAAATVFLLAFPYVTEYYLYFEHTLFPLCFTTLALGFLLLLLSNPSVVHASGVAWAGAAMAACYTPALASLALLVVGLPLLAWTLERRKDPVLPEGFPVARLANALYLAAGVVAFFGAASFAYGRHDRVTVFRDAGLLDSLSAVPNAYSIYFLGFPSSFAGGFAVVVALWLLAALLFRLGALHFVAAGWVLAVVGLAQLLRGYSVYAPAVSESRALVTVPVTVLCATLAAYGALTRIEERRASKGKRTRLVLPFAVALIVAATASASYDLALPLVQADGAKYFGYSKLQAEKYVVADMLHTADRAGIRQTDDVVLVVCASSVYLRNIKDFTGYFFPNAHVFILEPGMKLPASQALDGKVIAYVEAGAATDPRIDALGARVAVPATWRGKTFYAMERIAVGPASFLDGG